MTFDGLRDSIKKLRTLLGQSTTKQVAAKGVKKAARTVVLEYFDKHRPKLVVAGLQEQDLSDLDSTLQDLLELSRKNALRATYVKTVKNAEKAANAIESLLLLKRACAASSPAIKLNDRERGFVDTLHALVPTAALSYEQACLDLSCSNRKSYRGAATELRESLRELLDHLAPDKEVMNQPSFNLEKNQTKPTMKQKTRFILRSRGKNKSVYDAPESAVGVIEDSVCSLARAVYNRSSLSTHMATTLKEVKQIKAYVDIVLSELLELS
jgi:hypothetical protein